jgi:hypothetical protein
VKGLVNQILQYGRVMRPSLGVVIAPPQALQRTGFKGVLVLDVSDTTCDWRQHEAITMGKGIGCGVDVRIGLALMRGGPVALMRSSLNNCLNLRQLEEAFVRSCMHCFQQRGWYQTYTHPQRWTYSRHSNLGVLHQPCLLFAICQLPQPQLLLYCPTAGDPWLPSRADRPSPHAAQHVRRADTG